MTFYPPYLKSYRLNKRYKKYGYKTRIGENSCILQIVQFHTSFVSPSTHKHNKTQTSKRIEQKGMTFDNDFGYSFPLFSSLLKKEGGRKGE